jgi:hypothetical protein
MNILVTLNSGLGADTGPNFNLTADVGSVTPNTATKVELLAGKFVDVDPSATQITVTSVGTCTTSIVLTITGQTTTTTTSAVAQFSLGYDASIFFTACTDFGTSPTTYYASTGAILQVGTQLYSDITLTTLAADGYYSDGVNWWRIRFGNGFIASTGSCTTTTSTTSTSTSTTSTSTTTTAAPTTTTTSTSTTQAPVSVSLGYDATTGWQSCYAAATTYYIPPGATLQIGTFLYSDINLTTPAVDGYYSNGANYWSVSFGEMVSEDVCPTTSTTSTTSTSTTSTSTSTSTTSTSTSTSTTTSTSSTTSTTTGAPTSTTTSTSSTTSTTTQPGDTTTTTTSTTAAPTSTTTSTSSTTSTTTQPGDTTTTTTSTTAAPTSTTTSTSSTTSTTTTTTTAAPQCTYDGLTVVCDSTTTTTTDAPTTTTTTEAGTTTTTTAGINYISYPADKYVCDAPNCGAFVEATEIAFPDTFTPVINKWYSPSIPNGYAYQLTSTTPSTGPGLVMYEGTFNTCGLACSV